MFITEEEKATAPERVRAAKEAAQRALDQQLAEWTKLTKALHRVDPSEAHLAPIGTRVFVEGENDFFWAKVSDTGTWENEGTTTPWVTMYENGYGVEFEDCYEATKFTFDGASKYVKVPIKHPQ